MKIFLIPLLFLHFNTSIATTYDISTQNRIYIGVNDNDWDLRIIAPFNDMQRDAVSLPNNRVALYNGTFTPVINIWSDNNWTEIFVEGFSTSANGGYGGIASNGRYIWATDMRTGGGLQQGVLQIDLDEINPTLRFAEDTNPWDLTLGKDELLYVLYDGAGGEENVNIYDPTDHRLIKTINLSSVASIEAATIAVDENSNIYIADTSGRIELIDTNLDIIGSIETGEFIVDIDIVDDMLIVGTRIGRVLITDLQLQAYERYFIQDIDGDIPSSNAEIFIMGESVETGEIRLDFIFTNSFD